MELLEVVLGEREVRVVVEDSLEKRRVPLDLSFISRTETVDLETLRP